MTELPQALLTWFNGSPLRELSNELLRGVPGLPPILQTVHLLGVAVLMGSIFMISLRVLNLACRRQDCGEMMRRLFPWFFWSLPVMLLSALPFFLARPQRYISNPVFGIKMLMLILAIGSALLIWHWYRNNRPLLAADIFVKSIALISVCAWLVTALAGRWIAYADYIFWPG